MVIRMLKELSGTYISTQKDIQTLNKTQIKMNNAIFEIKNTLEGIKSQLEKAEDLISKLEYKVEKHTIRAKT